MFTFKYKDYNFNCEIGTMTPNQYIKMIDLLQQTNPNNICELGSGQSTIIFDTFINNSPNIKFYSIEHDILYKTKYSVILELINDKYKDFDLWLNKQEKFDFVFIDGPNDVLPRNYKNLEFSRLQVWDFILQDKLNDNALILYHDSERIEAQNTLQKFEQLLIDKHFKFDKEIIKETNKEIINYNLTILETCPELTVYKIRK